MKENISEAMEEAMHRLDRLIIARAKKNVAMERLLEARDEARHAEDQFNEAVAHEKKMEEEFQSWMESQAQRFTLLEQERKQKGP